MVAVKRLISHDEKEFIKEQSFLLQLGHKDHPHLIKLLATYKYQQKYHLLFHFADANLRKYWEERPDPTFDRETVLWSLQQMTGIASGLSLLHNFTVTIPLTAPSSGNVRGLKDASNTVKRGEEIFGRHGDLKAENILWFKNGPVPKGVLQIADFGLGIFHGRDSRSRVNPESTAKSPTYGPPELKLHKPVSRACDMWSLGCMFLEYVTWLLECYKPCGEFSDEFAEFRARGSLEEMSEDAFFTIRENKGYVRKEVKDWVDMLHANEKCSEVLHNLLDFTMNEMLLIDSKGRCKASRLSQELKKYCARAEHDEEFLLKPNPRQPKPKKERPKSAPLGDVIHETIYRENPKRQVTFADREGVPVIQASRNDAKEPERLKASSCTWPRTAKEVKSRGIPILEQQAKEPHQWANILQIQSL